MPGLCAALFLLPFLKQVEAPRGYCYNTTLDVAKIVGDEKAELLFIKPRYRRNFPDGTLWHVVLLSNQLIFDAYQPRIFFENQKYFDLAFGEPVSLRRVSLAEIEANDNLWLDTLFEDGPWEHR